MITKYIGNNIEKCFACYQLAEALWAKEDVSCKISSGLKDDIEKFRAKGLLMIDYNHMSNQKSFGALKALHEKELEELGINTNEEISRLADELDSCNRPKDTVDDKGIDE